jgi:tetratricopeptide (TPR) repeat protein
MKRLCAIALLFSCWISLCNAQPAKKVSTDPYEAKEHFGHQNYLMAMPIYKLLVGKEPKNLEYNYNLGICYLRTYLNKQEAVKYFEVASLDPKCPNDTWYYLGRSYHIAGKFDEAIAAYTKYKTFFVKDNDKNRKENEKTDRQMEMCNNAKELIKYPINITFTNMGPEINSEYPDYFPFITADEQTLFYTSRRKGGHATSVESDGYFSSDVFYSQVLDGKWDKAKNLGAVNTGLDEEIVGLKPDGSELIIYIDHIDADKIENLYSSHKRNTGYMKIAKLSDNVTNAKEYAGTIADTEEGPVLFFSRKDNTCIGETDIFMARMLPTGQWALPQNLGSNINTKYREDFPFLSADGKTLYFSSEGHTSMGGFDLFKSAWDEDIQGWGKPQNLGYPLNTPDDEQQICMLSDNRAGYYSAWRPGGMGGLDIYRIKFEDETQKFSIITGKIADSDSLKKVCINIDITVTNLKTNEETFFKPNAATGKYVMALMPGKYNLNISCEGYKEINEELVIFDFGPNKPETIKDFKLYK